LRPRASPHMLISQTFLVRMSLQITIGGFTKSFAHFACSQLRRFLLRYISTIFLFFSSVLFISVLFTYPSFCPVYRLVTCDCTPPPLTCQSSLGGGGGANHQTIGFEFEQHLFDKTISNYAPSVPSNPHC
jgi:hypothetical protein